MRSLLNTCCRTKLALLAPLAAASLAVMAPAHADTMLLSDMTLVTGPETSDFSFVVPTAGTLTANLGNIPWPNQLSSLTFSANSSTAPLTPIVQSGANSGASMQTETFQVTPGNYFAHVTATPDSGLNLGLYSLSLSLKPSAVPLPASDWLLLSAGVLLLVVTRFAQIGSLLTRWRVGLRHLTLAVRELEAC